MPEQCGTLLHLPVPVFWLPSPVLSSIISPSPLCIVSLCLFLLSFTSLLPPTPSLKSPFTCRIHPLALSMWAKPGNNWHTSQHKDMHVVPCVSLLVCANTHKYLMFFFPPTSLWGHYESSLLSLTSPPPPRCLRSWERAGKRRSSAAQWKPVWEPWGAALAPGPLHSLHGCRKIFLSEVCLSFWAHGARLIPGSWVTSVAGFIYLFFLVVQDEQFKGSSAWYKGRFSQVKG